MNRKMEFFNQLYLLKHLSNNGLRKMIHSFVLQYYNINQIVYQQGACPKNVYVALTGEFEIIKRFKDTTVVDETEIDKNCVNDKRLFSGCRRKDILVKVSRLTKG